MINIRQVLRRSYATREAALPLLHFLRDNGYDVTLCFVSGRYKIERRS